MSDIIIREITTKKERSLFVDYPNKLYADNPNFVPSFYGDDMADWDPEKNPAFSYCEAKAFLAYRVSENGHEEIVGRIGAILSHKANEKWETNRMRFSQVDFVDDPAVSKALFDAVESWAREKGCTEVHGPLGFCDLDREGMLVDGYDKRSMFITYYNDPYYIEHLESLGYIKDVDWIEHMLPLGDENDPNYQKLKRISETMLRRTNLRKVDLKSRKDIRKYVRKFFELVNLAYADLYGEVDLTEEQIVKYTDKFLPLVNPDFCCLIINDEDELIGFGVGAPSVAEAMKKCRGRLFPLGWIGVLRALRSNNALDLFLIAIRPEYRKTGLNGVIMEHLYAGCIKHGIRWAETGPQLENNNRVHTQWKMFNVDEHKRRRCFVKKLV